jgi:transcriptional regulator with XRE-family HTH domain
MYGQVVKQARLARGLTQHDLARTTGIEQPNISAIEQDRRRPSADTLHRLLLACGFELVAQAGPRVLTFPASVDDEVAPVRAARPIPMPTRVRMLTAALDASEAIVRSR